ncbi:MAG: hypothetical protein ACR2F6_08095 [Mycobacteriales bacterium]
MAEQKDTQPVSPSTKAAAEADASRPSQWWEGHGTGFWFLVAVAALIVFGVVLGVVIGISRGSGSSSNNPSLGPPAITRTVVARTA